MGKISESIPNLTELYNMVYEFVKQNQGEKGYIDTQDDQCDRMSAYVYDEGMGCAVEQEVHGIRADTETDDIEIIVAPIMRTYKIQYDDESFKSKDAVWESLRYGDVVYYGPTLLEIASVIEEYVES